jgi:hypothetical protein
MPASGQNEFSHTSAPLSLAAHQESRALADAGPGGVPDSGEETLHLMPVQETSGHQTPGDRAIQ